MSCSAAESVELQQANRENALRWENGPNKGGSAAEISAVGKAQTLVYEDLTASQCQTWQKRQNAAEEKIQAQYNIGV